MNGEYQRFGLQEDLIECLDNHIFVQHIYSRLSPRERAICSCINQTWAKLHRQLNLRGELAEFIISGRKLWRLPQVPSLIAFNEIWKWESYPYISMPQGFYTLQLCTSQLFFDGNSKHVRGRPQAHHGSGEQLIRWMMGKMNQHHFWTHETFHYVSFGSMLILTTDALESQAETEGYLGLLERSDSWRWHPMAPSALMPAVPHLDRPLANWLWKLHLLVVGRRVVKIWRVLKGPCPLVALGRYYQVDSKRWSNLPPLYRPDDVTEPVEAQHVFQWKNKLFVTGAYGKGYEDGPRYVCNSYDCERESWDGWNATPELLVLAQALRRLQRRWVGDVGKGGDHKTRFVAAPDETLFAVGSSTYYPNLVCFLDEDEWVQLPIPPLDEEVRGAYYGSRVWPLQPNFGIVIVSVVVLENSELAWRFVNKGGVYATGTFQRCNLCGNGHPHRALVYMDI